MKRLTESEIKQESKKMFDKWIACYGLRNAKKVAREVRRLLIAEEKRRKQLEKKK